MQRSWLIAIGSGLVSALLFLSVVAGNLLSLLLIYLAPLPLVIASLGWGPAIGLAAALTGTVFLGTIMGPVASVMFFLLYAGPPVLFARLMLMARTEEDGTVSHYPAGYLLAWIGAIAIGLVAFAHYVLASAQGGLPSVIEEVLPSMMPDAEALVQQLRDAGLEMTREEFFRQVGLYAPAITAVLWYAIVVINLTLGQMIVRQSGLARRPALNWARTELPFSLAPALAVALLLAQTGGDSGFIGFTASIILAVPYFLMGLISIHVTTRIRAALSPAPEMNGALRFAGLVFLYFMLLVEQQVTGVLITCIGILDQWFGLRQRAFAAMANSDGQDQGPDLGSDQAQDRGQD